MTAKSAVSDKLKLAEAQAKLLSTKEKLERKLKDAIAEAKAAGLPVPPEPESEPKTPTPKKPRKPSPKKEPAAVQEPECIIYLLLNEYLNDDEYATLGVKKNQRKSNVFQSNNPISGMFQFSEFIHRCYKPVGHNSMRGLKVLTLFADAPLTFLLMKAANKVIAALKVEREDFLTESHKAMMFDIDQLLCTPPKVPNGQWWTELGISIRKEHFDRIVARSSLLRDSVEWLVQPPLPVIEEK